MIEENTPEAERAANTDVDINKSDLVAEEIFDGAAIANPFVCAMGALPPDNTIISLPEYKELTLERNLAELKPRWEFLDFRALQEAAEVMAINEQKHHQVNAGAEFSDGWKKISYVKHFGSFMRHIVAHHMYKVSGGKFGALLDAETGKRHLAHAFCRNMFLLAKSLEEDS